MPDKSDFPGRWHSLSSTTLPLDLESRVSSETTAIGVDDLVANV